MNRGNGLPVKTRVPGLEPEFDETCGIFEDMYVPCDVHHLLQIQLEAPWLILASCEENQ